MIQMTLQEYIDDCEYSEFKYAVNETIRVLESGSELNEGLLDKFSKKAKEGINFINEFASLIGARLLDILRVFKEKAVFTFFSKLKWSMKKLLDVVKKGFKLHQKLVQIIADFIAESKIVQWTNENLKKLDAFLNEHPFIKKAGALLVIGFLIYQWSNMISFTGDIDFDFDQSILFSAISGNYSLADLFASPDGVKMLIFIATGVGSGASFPWPGNTWALFALSIVYTVAKSKYPTVANNIKKNYKKIINNTKREPIPKVQ